MNIAKFASLLCLAASAATLFAQLTTAPVLTAAPNIPYPPIARAAHVEGDVVVSFSIDSDGRTVSVQTVSGPAMLRGVVEDQIKRWRFVTPLPVGAQSDFESTYKFRLHAEGEDLDDDLDGPPYIPCCGDLIGVRASSGQVTGDVRSVDGSQSIDVSAAPAAPAKDRCPEDKEKIPPTHTTADDFVELYRTACTEECRDYKVRVYRNGRIEWHGKDNVDAKGDRVALLKPDAADALLAKFQSDTYWAACSSEPPPAAKPGENENDIYRADYLTANIDGHTKVVNVSSYSFVLEDTGVKFAWALDKAADSHRWRHGDASRESYTDMLEDLEMPKPGVTALMRATYRFVPGTGQQTLEPLEHFIANGADVDATDESGWTALMYAAQLDTYYPQVAQLLLEAHASATRASLHGDTVLMIAAYHGSLSESLLKAGADINARNADGVTALMLLAQQIAPDELKETIAAGADASAQDEGGRTALDYLRAASCEKPLIALPKQGMQIVLSGPAPCPSNSADYLKSEALLRAAMKKSSAQ